MTVLQKIRALGIANHYGYEHQYSKVIEELGECITQISKTYQDKTDDNLNELAQEIADVKIMMYQWEELNKIRDRVWREVDRKLRRQEMRIQKEKRNEKV